MTGRYRTHAHRAVWGVAAVVLTAGLVASCGGADDAASGTPSEDVAEATTTSAEIAKAPDEELTATRVGDVTVHTFHRKSGENATYIIESANAVVVVDTQFKNGHPSEFRAAVDSIGKPIEGVFVTHQHADHIGGLDTAFADVRILATAGVAESIAGEGRDIEVVEGTFTIDDVAYTVAEVADAEAKQQMYVTIADGQALFAGDLVSHNTHGFLTRSIGNWISILEGLAETPAEYVFPGHGLPAGPELLDENINYLRTAGELLASSATADDYTDALVAAFPDHAGPPLIAFYAEGLVGEKLLDEG